ncbi:MAG: hypothetical protein FWD01_05375, partial [Defluviitaleaceae bacterium]|nr:hypothetical protein [Defluviitaleaceae bacterium]
EGGSSSGHLYRIFEALARIGLTFRQLSFTDYLNELTDEESIHVIVSSNHENSLMNAFEELENRGISAYMIIPHYKEMKINAEESENLMLWEVAR